ncbi:hypothetical protein AMJ85_04555 [candidate division BRC1 bacterium SM23_51]|nr:MAG: hypothetical protein AMJ85_04555 [candidate division BRC1 bacterium SM23_51]
MTYVQFLNSELGRWVGERLTSDQSDVVHDLLAHLAEQMIEMNKQKQSEAKGFLAWLERRIGSKVDDLANKTKLRAYYDHDFQTMVAVLRKNTRKLKVKITRVIEEEIDCEFKRSLEKLGPLLTSIAATDRLIDLVVYQLYGLTDEEAAIVEGTLAESKG